MPNNKFLKEAKFHGFSEKTGFNRIGFVFKNLLSSQSLYAFTHNCNKWLANNFGTEFSMFFEENGIPNIPMNFARYNISETFYFEGHLIATSFESLKSIISTSRCKKYLYINDIEYIRPNFDDKQLFDNIINDKNIVKIFRSSDHYDKFIKDGYNIEKIIIPDFDIYKIVEFTNKGVINEN